MRKSHFKKIITTLVSVTVYFVLSAVVLVHANGLQFEDCNLNNLQACSVEGTAGIYLDGDVTDPQLLTIRLNTLPLDIRDLPEKILWLKPGEYKLDVEAEGYVSLHKQFELPVGNIQRIYITMIPERFVFESAAVLPYEKWESLQIRQHHEIWDTARNHDIYLGRMSDSLEEAISVVDGYMAVRTSAGKVMMMDWEMQNRMEFPWENVVALRASKGDLYAELGSGEIMVWNN